MQRLRLWSILGVLVLAAAGAALAIAANSRSEDTTVRSTQPAGPPVNIAVIGDSYTSGSAVGGVGERSWTAVLQRSLDATGRQVNLRVGAQGGSGYVNRGGAGKTFGDSVLDAVVQDTQLVVFFGSVNDRNFTAADLRGAVRAAFISAQAIAPEAQLLVIGPPWVNEPIRAELTATIHAAADEFDAQFVDPAKDGWFLGTHAALIGSDGGHPTDQGHVYMAGLIQPYIEGFFD